MGRWMEVFQNRIASQNGEYRGIGSLGGAAPHPLMEAARCLGRTNRESFPLLELIRLDSRVYVDETLWLNAADARRLLDEVRRLRDVCRRHAFLPGIDGARVYALWRDGIEPSEFDRRLDRLEDLLQRAAENGHWLKLSL